MAKRAAVEQWIADLGSPEGSATIFRLSTQMKSDWQDINEEKFIKEEQDTILVEEPQIMNRGRRYTSIPILNVTNSYEEEEAFKVEGLINEISEKNVRKSLKKMNRE